MSTHLESSIIGSRQGRTPPKSCWAKFLGLVESCLRDEDKVKWVENMRGSLSLMASIIATMTLQLATNPPGGVFQANGGVPVSYAKICLDNDTIQCPGEAVMAVVYEKVYTNFLICNTVSFIASLTVCLLLVSGIPLKHRLVIWVLSIGMCITTTSLALTYMFAASMVTPDPVWEATDKMFGRVLEIWVLLLGIVGVYLII
uniref:PGG domain-containing protein n=1 Tax=Lotus japonicus TaxID=34305 RepID=I3SVR5_LOTJA|nr:unknown [Lotus japonicus]